MPLLQLYAPLAVDFQDDFAFFFTRLTPTIDSFLITSSHEISTTLYAMSVSADQLPVYKAIVVVIIVSLQSKEFIKIIRGFNLNKKKAEVAHER